jgi:hypothetical protein
MNRTYKFTPSEFQGPELQFREFKYSVGTGYVLLKLPARMVREDWEHVEEMNALIMRSIKRGVHLEQQP